MISERKMKNLKFQKSGKSWVIEYSIPNTEITYNIHIGETGIFKSMSDAGLWRKSPLDLKPKSLENLTKWYNNVRKKLLEQEIELGELS